MIKQKIIKLSKRVGRRITKSYLAMTPVEVAYHYLNVADDNGRRLIERILKIAPKKYAEKTRYYIGHPIEMQEKISELEKKFE